jgi:hypothetical protein
MTNKESDTITGKISDFIQLIFANWAVLVGVLAIIVDLFAFNYLGISHEAMGIGVVLSLAIVLLVALIYLAIFIGSHRISNIILTKIENIMTTEVERRKEKILRGLTKYEEIGEILQHGYLIDTDQMVKIEKSVKKGEIWILTALVYIESENEDLQNAIIENLNEGVKYVYLIPDTDDIKEYMEQNIKKWKTRTKRDDIEDKIECYTVPAHLTSMTVIVYIYLREVLS